MILVRREFEFKVGCRGQALALLKEVAAEWPDVTIRICTAEWGRMNRIVFERECKDLAEYYESRAKAMAALSAKIAASGERPLEERGLEVFADEGTREVWNLQ